ncbi:hypothetical protein FB558_4959 [Pseudonocardia kunmingensis]|uniref:Uncharacterized protein n=1 Tax=Pseudonocardia kunmingensis TaxID=630975 RepID=A0A543DIQ7_9PSEU|nr:hypothetical protein FB558_4959 [Pseudonocardia kunmingensis]
MVGAPAALVGELAVFGGLYYSFTPPAPGVPISLQTAMVPWVCLAVAVERCGRTWARSSTSSDPRLHLTNGTLVGTSPTRVPFVGGDHSSGRPWPLSA